MKYHFIERSFWRHLWDHKKPEIFCGLLCFLAVAGLATILVRRHLYVTSDYALLQAYFIPINPQVSGEVVRVNVIENQAVKKGQVLCTLDDRPYVNAERQAESDRDALVPQWKSSQQDLQRANDLFRRGSIAVSQRDAALATARSFEARYQAAQAELAVAKLNRIRTQVIAPADGMIAFRSAQVGMFASTKTPLFGFVADQTRWVEARIKETDLSGIRIGDTAEVTLDSVANRKFSGVLESIGQSTEAVFAAIPDDFSAGNFTKYAQWVPVRIRLKLNLSEEAEIPIGVSSEVKMKRRRS